MPLPFSLPWYQVVPEPPKPGNGCFDRRRGEAVRCCRARRALVGQCPRNRLVEAWHFYKRITVANAERARACVNLAASYRGD